MLPEAFLSRMQDILGEDYPAFLSELSKEQHVRGLRVNTRKLEGERLRSLFPSALSPLSYAENGFITDEEKPGRLPLHHAGAFYMQDPSAIATLSALTIEPHFRVLDLCAAPGGKSTQAASFLTGGGYLVANEFVPQRTKILVSNIERLGIPNAVVLNSDVFHIAEQYPLYFDLVLVDAPCSGEGMLRKYGVAGEEWSEDNVALCAARQEELLAHASKTVAGGGYLLYSTCTFSVEENERNVDAFLSAHSDFALVPVRDALLSHTADGIDFSGAQAEGLSLCRRFYPHLSKGEGQFFALMRRKADAGREAEPRFRDAKKPLSREERAAVDRFLCENVADRDGLSVFSVGGRPTLLPPEIPVPENRVFLSGVLLGEVKKGILFPHHQFFMAYGNRMKRILALTSDDPRTARYLRGEEIEAPELENGWACVTVDGCTLGGAKLSGGRAKNHYPKGLREKG